MATADERDALFARVQQCLRGGQPQQAALACRTLCEMFPRFTSGWYLGSLVAQQLGRADKALDYIERALQLEPGSAQFMLRRAALLVGLRRVAEARQLVQRLAQWPAPSAALLADLGAFHTMLGEHETALPFYQRALAANPGHAQHWFDRALTERFLGRTEDSERSYSEGLRLNPRNGEAYYLRAGLRRQTEDHHHIAEMETFLDTCDDDWMSAVQVCYALAKECEDLRQYRRSFAYLKRGADLRRAHLHYNVAADIEAMDTIAATYSAAALAPIAPGCASAEPIFVVGLPRSGTTLVERILGSHSAVFGAGELNNFALEMTASIAASGARPADKRDAIAASLHIDFAKLGQRYLDSTRPQTGHTPFFVDKMPLNYLYCGLIAKALPNAKIIELVRDPIDNAYAMYKQLFTVAYPFSYDLGDLAEYTLAYRRLMAHWQRVLPGRILRVSYEALVGDQAGTTRQLLDHCGLSWQDACLAFERNPQASTTASAVQVREKIYSSSIGKWRHYSDELQPLVERLRQGGAFGVDVPEIAP